MIKPVRVNPLPTIATVEYKPGFCIDFYTRSPVDMTLEQIELFKQTANEIMENIEKKVMAKLFTHPPVPTNNKASRSPHVKYPFMINYKGA